MSNEDEYILCSDSLKDDLDFIKDDFLPKDEKIKEVSIFYNNKEILLDKLLSLSFCCGEKNNSFIVLLKFKIKEYKKLINLCLELTNKDKLNKNLYLHLESVVKKVDLLSIEIDFDNDILKLKVLQ